MSSSATIDARPIAYTLGDRTLVHTPLKLFQSVVRSRYAENPDAPMRYADIYPVVNGMAFRRDAPEIAPSMAPVQPSAADSPAPDLEEPPEPMGVEAHF